MRSLPRAPRAGEPIRAELLREICEYLRAITPLEGSNIRLQRTPNGTHFSAMAAAGTAAKSMPQCWDVGEVTQDQSEAGLYRVKFARRFARIGGRTTDLSDEQAYPAAHTVELRQDAWSLVALRSAATEPPVTDDYPYLPMLAAFTPDDGSEEDLDADAALGQCAARMSEAEKDLNYYLKPLWLFRGAGPVVDLRTMPNLQMYEA